MLKRSGFFVPGFDADGNQYHIQTETGDWALNYNAANRPTDFSCMDEEGNFLTVKCDYDFMGCRVFKKVISGTGNVTQPIQWSSEFNDSELGLVYYNWRYYNAMDGRWLTYDIIVQNNPYLFVNNAI